MNIGQKNREEIIVTRELTAIEMKSGTLEVFATPAMIALCEDTAKNSISKDLEENMTTVGTDINIKHLAPTPLDMKVYCESELVKIDGRALTFELKVYDECGLIGEGTHQRFIVDSQKFQAKANKKREDN